MFSQNCIVAVASAELKMKLRSRASIVFSLLFLVFMGTTAWVGRIASEDLRKDQEEVTRFAESEWCVLRDRLRKQEERGSERSREGSEEESSGHKSPQWIMDAMRPFAIFQLSQLAPLATGNSSLFPQGVDVSERRNVSPLASPVSQLQGPCDPQEGIVFFIPLLAILTAADSLTGEIDSGRWKVLRIAAPRFEIIFGKHLANTGWVCGVCLAGSLISCVIVLGSPAGISDVFKSAAWCAGGVIYSVCWATLFMLISLTTRRTRSSIFASFLVFLGIVVLIPRLLPLIARFQSPEIPRAELSIQVRADRNKAIQKYLSPEKKEFLDELLGPLKEEFPELKNEGHYSEKALRNFAWRHRWLQIADESARKFNREVESQYLRLQKWSVVSPASAFESFSQSVCGTDPLCQCRFATDVDEFRKRLTSSFFPSLFPSKNQADEVRSPPAFTSQDFDRLPKFERSQKDAISSIADGSEALTSLLAWTLVLNIGLAIGTRFSLSRVS